MPGRSSTALGDTSKMESLAPLLGAAGQAGSVNQQDGIKDEQHSAMHSTPLTAEGACWREQYCILVWIETARDKKPLQAHAWGETLLKDFFQAIIGIPYAIMIISPTECMFFAPGRSKDLGMSYKDSRAHCQQLNGINPWVGSAVEVTALQGMVKEGRYDVARAKQYMHERTKERLAKMRALPTSSPTESPQPWHTLPEPARGRGMTRQADQYFIQETLRNMNLQDRPSRPGTPLRESHPATPEAGQCDSPDMDDPEEDLTSQANFNSEDEYTDATGRSGRSLPAKHNRRRNHAMHRERACVKRNFHQGGLTWGWKLAFSLFRESNWDDSISYRDWWTEVEAALAKGYEPEWVKIAMFKAMESMAKDHVANIDQYGVLEGMDWLYGVSMTFQSLHAALCRLQQWATETCQDYYDRFTQITMLLWERHSNRFCPGELARMSKDCFYAGLRAEHRPMVVHLKDRPNSTP